MLSPAAATFSAFHWKFGAEPSELDKQHANPNAACERAPTNDCRTSLEGLRERLKMNGSLLFNLTLGLAGALL